MAAYAFGGESNRGQRILDLMGNTPRHLAPGGLLLGFEQIGHIFEYQHVTQARVMGPFVGSRVATVTATLSSACGIHFHLAGRRTHAVGAPQQWFQIFQNFGRKNIRQPRQSACRARHFLP